MKRSVRIISVMIVLMISVSFVFALDTTTTGYRISGGAQKSIDVHGTCRNVYMEVARQVFVPTKTSTEWNSFLAHPPYGVVVSACAYCGDGVCNGDEGCLSCPGDCEARCPTCGNGACETWKNEWYDDCGGNCVPCWEDCNGYGNQDYPEGWGPVDDSSSPSADESFPWADGYSFSVDSNGDVSFTYDGDWGGNTGFNI